MHGGIAELRGTVRVAASGEGFADTARHLFEIEAHQDIVISTTPGGAERVINPILGLARQDGSAAGEGLLTQQGRASITPVDAVKQHPCGVAYE